MPCRANHSSSSPKAFQPSAVLPVVDPAAVLTADAVWRLQCALAEDRCMDCDKTSLMLTPELKPSFLAWI